MTTEEAEVIEWAIEWTNQVRHGLYRHQSINSHCSTELREAVDRLQAEHDGQWQAKITEGR